MRMWMEKVVRMHGGKPIVQEELDPECETEGDEEMGY